MTARNVCVWGGPYSGSASFGQPNDTSGEHLHPGKQFIGVFLLAVFVPGHTPTSQLSKKTHHCDPDDTRVFFTPTTESCSSFSLTLQIHYGEEE